MRVTNVKDDFLAAAVAFEERACGFALVASGDRDSFQLASDRITILYPSRGGQLTRVRPEEVRQRYGVDPQPVPDFIALRGDPRINCLDPWGLDQYAPLNWGGDTEAMIHPSTRGRRVAVVDYSEA